MDRVLSFMKEQEDYFMEDIYLVGGALCDRKVKDYDLVVLTESDPGVYFHLLERAYKRYGLYDSIQIHRAYETGEDDISSDIAERFHTIAKIKRGGVNFDLLFAHKENYPTIDDVLLTFPMSIQMRYMSCNGRVVEGTRFSRDPIFIYRSEHAANSICKYKEYYPERDFIYV